MLSVSNAHTFGFLRNINCFLNGDPAVNIYLNLSFALKGAGDTYFVSLIALLVPWPLMVLPTFFLQAYEKAALYAWSFVVIYSIATTGILIWRFQKGKWKTMSVIH
jgi:multidrug resistance protein, MATE family